MPFTAAVFKWLSILSLGPAVYAHDFDKLKTSGTPAIVNGLSCMACHGHGMINLPGDQVRHGSDAKGAALEQVQRLLEAVDSFFRQKTTDLFTPECAARRLQRDGVRSAG